ncbi:hypothetical protein [Candidatus Chromulinivorax destructor]|nr:hypothetical protein [Candidatus Chromulinivorax destructor]
MNILVNFSLLLLFLHGNLWSMQEQSKPRSSYTHTINSTQHTPYITCAPQFAYETITKDNKFDNQDQTITQASLQGAVNIIEQYENFNALYLHNAQEQACLLATISDIDTTLQNLPTTTTFYDLIDNKNIAPLLLAMSTTVPAIHLLCLFEKYFSLKDHPYTQAMKAIEDQLVESYYPFHETIQTLIPIIPHAHSALWNLNRTMILHNLYESLQYQKNILVDTTNAYEQKNVAVKNLADQKSQYTDALMHMQAENNVQNGLPVQAAVKTVENDTTTKNNTQLQENITKQVSKKSLLSMHTKTNRLQKQLQEKIADEKRAEQSRIDKERHQAALIKQQEEALAAAAKLAAIQKNKSIKKKKKLAPEQLVVDEDEAYLDQLITEKNISNSTIQAADTLALTDGFDDTTTAFVNFIQTRNQKILALQQAKEIQRKKDILTCLKTAVKDRDNKKDYLEKKRDKDFSYNDENEKLALQYLEEYTNYVLAVQGIDENFFTYFQIATERLLALEDQFTLQGTHLKWYLATNPALYKKMKAEYVQLNRILYKVATYGEKAVEMYHLQEIAGSLQKIHTAGGILDITEYIYPIKTNDEIDQLATLPDNVLKQAQQDIELLYANVPVQNNHQLLQPIIEKLLHKAEIKTQPLGVIDEMVHEAQKISAQETNQQNQSLQELDINTFKTLQKVTEMSDLNFTEHTTANLTKIYAVVIRSLVKILQLP